MAFINATWAHAHGKTLVVELYETSAWPASSPRTTVSAGTHTCPRRPTSSSFNQSALKEKQVLATTQNPRHEPMKSSAAWQIAGKTPHRARSSRRVPPCVDEAQWRTRSPLRRAVLEVAYPSHLGQPVPPKRLLWLLWLFCCHCLRLGSAISPLRSSAAPFHKRNTPMIC